MRITILLLLALSITDCVRTNILKSLDNQLYVNKQVLQGSEQTKFDGKLGNPGIVVLRVEIDTPASFFRN